MDKYLKYKKRYLDLKNQKGGEYKTLQQPHLKNLPPNLSLITQFRYFFKIIECYMINQVFSEFKVEENDFTKEIFKNICDINLSGLEEEEERWKEFTSKVILGLKDNLIDYPPVEFRKFGNLIDKEALTALYAIKKNFLDDEKRMIVHLNKKIPDKSIQNILFGKIIDKQFEELTGRLKEGEIVRMGEVKNYSNNIILFSKNKLVRHILEPFHYLGNEIIPTKYIDSKLKEADDEEEYDDEDDADLWYKNTTVNLVTDLFGLTLKMFTRRVMFFAEDIIPEIKEMYEKNPSVELALILARLGIPYSFNKILDPPPNPVAKMTKEEYKKIKPLLDLINQLEYYVKYDSKNLFTKYFENILKRNAAFTDSLVKFKKVKVKLPTGTNFEVELDSSLLVRDIKLIIIDYINDNILNAYINEKNDLIKEPVNPSTYNFMFNLGSKIVIMEDERSINDYNIMNMTNPEISLNIKIKSGFLGF
jgi:hypothetical protein